MQGGVIGHSVRASSVLLCVNGGLAREKFFVLHNGCEKYSEIAIASRHII
jgi:hypothetical protein